MIEPTPVVVTRYRCAVPGCSKSYAGRSRARKHASECPKDMDNRSCLTCDNFDDGDVGGCGDPGSLQSCRVGNEIDRPMPRGCPDWVESRGWPHGPSIAYADEEARP